MSEPIKLVAFCGSLRKASFNRMALQAFTERAPAGTTVETIEIDWPLYDADIQAQGFPDKVQAAHKAMLAADGIVFASPEYNYSISGVLKNAIDWLSRTTPQPFAGKPMAVFGASGGPLGTARSQYHLRQMMIFLDGRMINKPEVMIGAAPSKFADGKFTDEVGSKLLTELGVALLLSVRQHKAHAHVK
jgi:chromate reductase, NAD(P)H dehydrogenase (quinone)